MITPLPSLPPLYLNVYLLLVKRIADGSHHPDKEERIDGGSEVRVADDAVDASIENRFPFGYVKHYGCQFAQHIEEERIYAKDFEEAAPFFPPLRIDEVE